MKTRQGELYLRVNKASRGLARRTLWDGTRMLTRRWTRGAPKCAACGRPELQEPARKGAEKRLKQEKNDKNRIQAQLCKLPEAEDAPQLCQVNLERCNLCMESSALRTIAGAARGTWKRCRSCMLALSGKKFFRKDAVMSVSPHASAPGRGVALASTPCLIYFRYLCVDAHPRCVVPGQARVLVLHRMSGHLCLSWIQGADCAARACYGDDRCG